jgi:putative drug exporter of the RND superfamily
MLENLARSCFRHRRRVVAIWVVAFIGMAILGRVAAGDYSANFNTPGSESKAALDLLNQKFPERSGDTISVIFKADRGVNDAATRARVGSLLTTLKAHPHVVGVISPYDPAGAGNVSRDGTIAFASLQLDVQGPSFPAAEGKELIKEAKAAAGDGVRFELGGQAIANAELVQGGGAEGIGILVAMIILLVSFGSVVAAGLPILTAIMGIGIGLAILELLANVFNVANFSPIVAAMIGIGVGIDYALFIVTRYRAGLQEGHDPEQATVSAISTAGRAVIFAGTTVVISVMGILLMGLPFLQGVAYGPAGAVLVAMLASVTLLPAMLGFAGRSIDKLRLPLVGRKQKHHREGFWFRWSRLVQRRPWPAVVISALVIIVLAIPVFSMRLGFPGDQTQPTSKTSRRAYDLFTQGFGPGFSAPLVLAVDMSGGRNPSALSGLESRLRTEPGVAAVIPAQVNTAGDAAIMLVFPTTDGQSVATENLVHRMRDSVIPQTIAGSGLKVDVGGPNAGFIDGSAAISRRLPIFIGVVMFLSFILLMSVFRSVLVALKAAVMNLVSIAAAYGVLVAVAQWGWLKSLFGIHTTAPIANFVPMMMFAILFGLSMDYEVFLLSRIREEYTKTGDNGLAVADGLAATARVITAAAAIMIFVFLSFVATPELIIKQIGLGLAAAILIDATLIRMVLVPATMELLGARNWWLPPWLDKALPEVKFEAPAPPSEPAKEPVGT